LGETFGYRNAQATVLAPTGTIAFMMDCDTTGVEPDLALVKHKKLAGGGTMTLVNRRVADALITLGYDRTATGRILDHLERNETIEGAPDLDPDHLPVFDCAFRPRNGVRSIAYQGHLRMMAAVQPFISGAISKTVNLPPEATVEDIEATYLEAWRSGLKSIAVYRDGCKRVQPLNTGTSGNTGGIATLGVSLPQGTPQCSECGTVTVPSGTCHRCTHCGETTGCS
jgi:ribonucleoside-diphosphate reductase alpha chain